jgi:hypothetical protein
MAKVGQSKPMTTILYGGVIIAILGLMHPMLPMTPKIWHFRKLTKDNFTHGWIWQII